MQDKPIMEQDWTKVPRAEMFSRVLAAVDSARGEAIELEGADARFARYCERALFPFLEAEQEKALEAEREHEEVLRDLLERSGVSEEEARLMMRDDDLWLLHPGARYGKELAGEEGVRQWELVVRLADAFAELAVNYLDYNNPAATQLMGDAAERATEALRRARERASTGDE